MYRIIILSFLGIWVSLVQGSDYAPYDCYGKPPLTAHDLFDGHNIDVDDGDDSPGNSTANSSLRSSPVNFSTASTITSPPTTFPLTSPNSTETPLLSPDQYEELKAVPSPRHSSRHFKFDQKKQRQHSFKKRCCMISSCAGVSLVAAVVVAIYKYTHGF